MWVGVVWEHVCSFSFGGKLVVTRGPGMWFPREKCRNFAVLWDNEPYVLRSFGRFGGAWRFVFLTCNLCLCGRLG